MPTVTAPYPWQQSQWRYLLQSGQQNRLAHAYLLAGDPGLGISDFCLFFAHRLLCQNYANSQDQCMVSDTACGKCKPCMLVKAGTHPDLTILAPAQANHAIKVDQIRQLQQSIYRTGLAQNRRIVIIDPADALNTAASNCLLKILEEPPSSTVFLLASEKPDVIALTVQSRCQRIRFYLPSETDALNYLVGKGITSDRAETVLRISQHAPLHAESLAQDLTRSRERDKILKGINQVAHRPAEIVSVADSWSGSELADILHHLLTWCTDLLHFHLIGSGARLINADYVDPLQRWPCYDQEVVCKVIDKINLARRSLYAANNLNKQLIIEDILASLVY